MSRDYVVRWITWDKAGKARYQAARRAAIKAKKALGGAPVELDPKILFGPRMTGFAHKKPSAVAKLRHAVVLESVPETLSSEERRALHTALYEERGVDVRPVVRVTAADPGETTHAGLQFREGGQTAWHRQKVRELRAQRRRKR